MRLVQFYPAGSQNSTYSCLSLSLDMHTVYWLIFQQDNADSLISKSLSTHYVGNRLSGDIVFGVFQPILTELPAAPPAEFYKPCDDVTVTKKDGSLTTEK